MSVDLFESGQRVRLVHTSDPVTLLRPGALGVVTRVRTDPWGSRVVSVRWDDGSHLSMLVDEGDVIEAVAS